MMGEEKKDEVLPVGTLFIPRRQNPNMATNAITVLCKTNPKRVVRRERGGQGALSAPRLGKGNLLSLFKFSTASTPCNIGSPNSSQCVRGSHVRSPKPHLTQNHRLPLVSQAWSRISWT